MNISLPLPNRSWSRPGLTFLSGILLVFALGAGMNPIQNDLGHVIGLVTISGGKALHPAQFELGQSLFGKFTLFLTASVIPPVSGDLSIELNGPEQVEYSTSSRYPPVVPLLNRFHPWYGFSENKLTGVIPGDDLVVILTMKPPKNPGVYELILRSDKTGQPVLTMPVIFSPPGASQTAGMPAEATEGEECH